MNQPQYIERYQSLNLLRLLLALLVTWSHCYPLAGQGGPEPVGNFIGIFSGGSFGVLGFFFISGMLITESWLNNNDVRIFVASRILRIWPAYLVAILFSALVSIYASKFTLSEMFPSVCHYISNNSKIFSNIEYFILGAFTENPLKGGINGSLWTLPWEARAYLVTLVVGYFGILSQRTSANALILLALVVLYQFSAKNYLPPSWDNKEIVFMLASYAMGMLVAVNRKELGDKKILIIIMVVFVASLIFLSKKEGWIYVIGLAAIIYLIATQNRWKLPDLKNDLSYGVYIYSFPIQQLIAYKIKGIDPMAMFAVSLPLIFLLSAFSWFAIEKPSLSLNKKIKKIITSKNLLPDNQS